MSTTVGLDIKQLRYFITVAEAGGFSAAASRAQVSQPSLGAQVRQLEKTLGLRLLERHARGVKLTQSGADFLPQAQKIVADLDALTHRMRAQSGEVFGTVRLGMTVSAALPLAARLLKVTAAQFPRINFRIIEALSSTLSDMTLRDELDLAVVTMGDFTGGLRGVVLASESFYLCANPGHALMREGALWMTEILDHPLMLPPGNHVLTARITEVAARYGKPVICQHVVESVSLIASFVEEGIGLSILPYSAIAQSCAEEKIAAKLIADPEITRMMSVIHSARRAQTPAEREVLTLLKALVHEDVAKGRQGWQALPSG